MLLSTELSLGMPTTSRLLQISPQRVRVSAYLVTGSAAILLPTEQSLDAATDLGAVDGSDIGVVKMRASRKTTRTIERTYQWPTVPRGTQSPVRHLRQQTTMR